MDMITFFSWRLTKEDCRTPSFPTLSFFPCLDFNLTLSSFISARQRFSSTPASSIYWFSSNILAWCPRLSSNFLFFSFQRTEDTSLVASCDVHLVQISINWVLSTFCVSVLFSCCHSSLRWHIKVEALQRDCAYSGRRRSRKGCLWEAEISRQQMTVFQREKKNDFITE